MYVKVLEKMREKLHTSRANAAPYENHDWLKFGFVRMILPQVHLRKPCYDFSFL